jgi:hypothetical protein
MKLLILLLCLALVACTGDDRASNLLPDHRDAPDTIGEPERDSGVWLPDVAGDEDVATLEDVEEDVGFSDTLLPDVDQTDADVEEPAPCVCTSGPCCDGCRFRARDTICGDTILDSIAVCVEDNPKAMQRRHEYLACDGESSQCGPHAAYAYEDIPGECPGREVCGYPDGRRSALCVRP